MARDDRDPIQSSAVAECAAQIPTLSICLRCRDGREEISDDVRGGTRLAKAVLQAGISASNLNIRGLHCLSQCKRPCAIAVSGPDRFTYLFGDLDPTRDAPEVVALAALYIRSPNGFMARDARPSPMRAGVLGRIPPLGWSGEAVETINLKSLTFKEASS